MGMRGRVFHGAIWHARNGLWSLAQLVSALTQLDERRERLFPLRIFVFFSIFLIGYLFFRPPTFSNLGDWIIVGGAFLTPVLALISWLSIRNDWSVQKEEQTSMRTLGYIVLAPVLLLMALIAGFALYSAFATIPSWAAVIIILLALIYLKK